MLEVGRNSYVAVAEADAYISDIYPNEVSEAWKEKSEIEKEQLLIGAAFALDSLPFPGMSTPGQKMVFPRWPNIEVPREIKDAQIEIAVFPLRPEVQVQNEEMKTRFALQQAGVRSFSIGKLSESYVDSGFLPAHAFLMDPKIWLLLNRRLQGSFAIC